MQSILAWLDNRTGLQRLLHEALFERIPGGSRWRYVWGSTLVFAFFVQLVTGVVLWMHYSPSTQTAWESVYHLEYNVSGGWLVRGLHHYMAHAMIVLLACHLMQVVIDGAYRAPREVNFWIGLILLQLVLALGLTGYLLPWDQKGYWATRVATKIVGITPFFGAQIQHLVVGGSEYGHLTLTRFFALHAGVLPGFMILLIIVHVALFRRHGITTPNHSATRADAYFWPDQILKDGVACLAVLLITVVLTFQLRAELGAPANPAEAYNAARPEWYFLFLFQFLKLFHGEAGERLGALYIPAAVFGFMFLMPFVGRWKLGHRFNVGFVFCLLLGIAWLTSQAVVEDRQAAWADAEEFSQPTDFLLADMDAEAILAEIEQDVANEGAASRYANRPTVNQLELYFESQSSAAAATFYERLAELQAFEKSRDYLRDVELAHAEAARARELAAAGIPPTGALSLLRADWRTAGHKLFRQHCASCHSHYDDNTQGDPTRQIIASEPSASNLAGFASHRWVRDVLDADHVSGPDMFGRTAFADGEMVNWVRDNIEAMLEDMTAEERATLSRQLDDVAMAVAAEADWPSLGDNAVEQISRGRELIETEFLCADCHKIGDAGDLGSAPDLTGYGSPNWLQEFISNPEHERFYPDTNDRMPAFADSDDITQNRLSPIELDLLVRWLRGQ